MAELFIVSDDKAASLGYLGGEETRFRFVDRLAITMNDFLSALAVRDEVMEWYFEKVVAGIFVKAEFNVDNLRAEMDAMGFPVVHSRPLDILRFLFNAPGKEGAVFLRRILLNVPLVTLQEISDLMRIREI